jgi:HTH-like domain
VAARNAQLRERIRALKAEHPFWGYRRIWAYLRYVDGLAVNQKCCCRSDLPQKCHLNFPQASGEGLPPGGEPREVGRRTDDRCCPFLREGTGR